MLLAERVPVGLAVGAALVAGAFLAPTLRALGSAPSLPPATHLVEPEAIQAAPVVQHLQLETCPDDIVARVRQHGRATCVHGSFGERATPGWFVHVSYYTTEWWEHIGVIGDAGNTVVAFVDRPSLYGDLSLRLRTADLDNDGIEEVIAQFGIDRAVEVFGTHAEILTLARVDADSVRDPR